MTEQNNNKIIKQALLLETKQRTAFISQLEEGELKQKIQFLLKDDEELTQFVLQTSTGAKSLENHQIKDLKSGDRINQFIIVKLIAKGGMGSVYLAYDEKLKRNVAIKTIRSEYMKNEATQQRFQQEAQILSQINHPSICQIYDYIDYEDGDLLVLELVSGITLSNIDLSDANKLEVFIQIASALEVAHDKNVIHRDLKPDNIMCNDDNQIKVLDFGIAKSSIVPEQVDELGLDDSLTNNKSVLTKMGTMMGTLLYMSPEQAQGEEVTKASDIYSLGIIMQEILTGVTVYDLANTEGLKLQVVNAKRINFELEPKRYQKLIVAMTQKDASHRPNAYEVINSLNIIKEIPKRRLMRVALFTIIILLVFGFSKYTYDLNQQKNTAQQAQIAAETARIKAEKSQQESEKVTEFLEGLFLESDPFANAGEEMTARQMLDKGSKKIDEDLVDQPSILFRLKATIGEIYTKLGEHELAQQQFDGISPMLDTDLIDDEMKLEFLSKQANEYYESSQVDKMEKTLQKGMEIVKNNKNIADHYYYDLLFNLGVAYEQKSEIDKSLSAYNESMQFFQKDKKTYQYKIIENYNSQAVLYSNLGENEKGIEYLEKALAMVNPQEDKDLDYKSTIKGNISYMLSNLGQYEKAIANGLSVIDLRKKLLGDKHIMVALAYDNISTSYMAANDIEKCIEYNSKALEVYKQSATKDNQHYIVSMLNRAVIYNRSGDDAKSVDSFIDVLPLLYNKYGKKHLLIANTIQSMAHGQINLKQYDKAEKNLLASIKMYDELHFPMKDRALESYKSLAILYNRIGNKQKALQTYKALLEILQSEKEKDPKVIAEIHQLIQDLEKKP
jgi:serine/threonine-protein kinase